MNVYDFSPKDLALWDRYSSFHLRFSNGFWSPGLVVRPYGTIQLTGKPQWGDVLWCANKARGWTVNDIIADVEQISARNLNRPGFHFSASFDQELAASLQETLPHRGYAVQYALDWLVLETLPTSPPQIPADLAMNRAASAEPFLVVNHEAFPNSNLDELFRRQIPNNFSGVNVEFWLLSDADNTPIGIGGVAWEGDLGYLFNLGIRPSWQAQGLGKLMIQSLLHQLQQQGVRRVVTGVLTNNARSHEIHAKAGYRPFAKAENWLKVKT